MTYPARPVPPAPRALPDWIVPALLVLGTMLNVGCGPDVVPGRAAELRWVDDTTAGVRCYRWFKGMVDGISCVRVTP